jgi:DNA polymerase-3 subunit delta'
MFMMEKPIVDAQRPQWVQMLSAPVAQSLLLTGGAASQARRFALAWAQRLLCAAPPDVDSALASSSPACGVCTACRLFAQCNHPDFSMIVPDADTLALESAQHREASSPESDSAPAEAGASSDTKTAAKKSLFIRIEQIRALADRIHMGAHQGGRRVIVIDPAENMNSAAANSLLKALEEPPPNVCFILISPRWRRLLPTVISRCQRLSLPPPPDALIRPDAAQSALIAQLFSPAARDFLSLAAHWEKRVNGVAPSAKASSKSLAKASTSRSSKAASTEQSAAGQVMTEAPTPLTLETLVILLQRVVADCARLACGAPTLFTSGSAAQSNPLAQRTGALSLHKLLEFDRALIDYRRLSTHPLNARLFLDDLASRTVSALSSLPQSAAGRRA